ncbi:MAG: DUF4236 domain-containing protein [Aliidiomarina sp.]|uniref:DUF4236 domain-containing protein n=1 Tax=Aliidiomarina sp. TaxID=1872439 RepID=UPI0025BD94FD|nr:DUF4236 domain-containing protein [Aliidiomarina sp.]MCH8500792.1 DUF4236 domain-containing protein [Aliidiomarina sp.]
MAFRFQRRVRIFPGVRLNFGKTGVSVSAGIRGASVTAGRRGVYGNVGAPGTGMSYRTRLDKSKAHQRRASRAANNRLTGAGKITLECDERGKLSMFNEDGTAASNALVRHIWEHHEAQVFAFLQQERNRINDDHDLLVNIHHDTPSLSVSPPEYEVVDYTQPEPKPPVLPDLPSEPAATPQRFWHRLLPSLEKRRCENNAAQHTRWKAEYGVIEQQRAELTEVYSVKLASWRNEKSLHEGEQKALHEAFAEDLRNDPNFMSNVLEQELSQLDWPRETQVDFEIMDGQLKLDVDLPTADTFPSKSAEFNNAQRRLLVREKSATQQRLEYARHVHGVVFRIAGVAFVTLPSIDELEVSAYTQTVSAATGFEVDEYLLSVMITRQQWATLNLEQLESIDLVRALEQFNLKRDMTKTGIFRPIHIS